MFTEPLGGSFIRAPGDHVIKTDVVPREVNVFHYLLCKRKIVEVSPPPPDLESLSSIMNVRRLHSLKICFI